MIDERRKRIREALDEADRARTEAQKLVEEHRATMAQARSQAEEILAEARKVAESQKRRLRDELEEDRQRRLEETSRQIEAETRARAAGDPLRGRGPDRDRDAEGDRQGARRRAITSG